MVEDGRELAGHALDLGVVEAQAREAGHVQHLFTLDQGIAMIGRVVLLRPRGRAAREGDGGQQPEAQGRARLHGGRGVQAGLLQHPVGHEDRRQRRRHRGGGRGAHRTAQAPSRGA